VGLVKPLIATSLGAVLLSCSANPEPRVLPELLARKRACLTLDWGAGPRATFYGRPAPDTLMLLPDRGEHLGYVDSADAWGRIELASSQQDRKGGGWVWWTVGDTLNIRAENPTMDGLVIWSVQPDEKRPATWREFGLTTSDASQGGRLGLRPYKCSGLPESAR
jgi:hypothetical protein